MTVDFEIHARLRARSLEVHRPTDAVRLIGENAKVEQRELRRGVPRRLRRGGRYADVVLEKEVHGSLEEPPGG